MSDERIREALVGWFRAGHRDLPWRRTRDPYAIWVSEIMLQQTQVETVVPYFERWMRRFPTVQALAEAPLDDVLQHWAGLGYYARARNLHRAAQTIAAVHGGRFPASPEAVRALPGIGPYTAGAILSIAFGLPEPILDGNVARVLARVFRVPGAPDEAETKKTLWALAARLVPAADASSFNQAMMELGALVCTPRAPGCARCPLAGVCGAREAGDPEAYPAPKKRAKVRALDVATVVCTRGETLLLARRPPLGLWGGLWEPPTGEVRRGEDRAAAAARVLRERTGLVASRIEPLAAFEHTLTHRRMRFHVFTARPKGRLTLDGYDAARWISRAAARELGVAAWTTRLLKV